jgi:hypothetical protein
VVERGVATEVEKPMEVVARLSADSVLKAARSSAARVHSAVTNDPRFLPKQPLSRRALDRRRKDLVSSFIAALGGPEAVSLVVAMQVRRAAELVTASEMARANMLNGLPVDMLALVRLEGVAARAIRQLGIKIEPPPAKARGLTLARQRWAEAEAKKAEKAKTAGEATHTMEAPDGC